MDKVGRTCLPAFDIGEARFMNFKEYSHPRVTLQFNRQNNIIHNKSAHDTDEIPSSDSGVAPHTDMLDFRKGSNPSCG